MFALCGMSIWANIIIIINRFFRFIPIYYLRVIRIHSTNLDHLFHQTMRFSNVKTESTEFFSFGILENVWRNENHELEIGYALDAAVRIHAHRNTWINCTLLVRWCIFYVESANKSIIMNNNQLIIVIITKSLGQ